MRYSTITEIATSRDMIDVFRGYNHNIRIGESEFYDMKNLTSSYYPVLSPRNKRGIYEYPASETEVIHSPNGLISKDALCYVDGTTLYINKLPVAGLTLTDTPKQLISMGAYIIIMPDKKYVNTKDLSDCGSIEAAFTSSSTVTYSMCKADGSDYGKTPIISNTEPENPENTDLWIDTSSTPHTLKQYSETSAVWVQIATTYVKISCAGIGGAFKQYDAVKISGIDSTIAQLKDLEGQVSPLWEVYHDKDNAADDYIVVIGILDTSTTQTSELTVERRMPNLDFIIESNNRLWGCRYGLDINGNVVNEIYASKLGDFKNWNCFMGLSTDSYTASCGTDGQFTGAITHLGYPLFFKENCLHKVYGNYPANYQIQTTECRGVMKGAGKSLAIVNEALFYKSRTGVCVYDGSLPAEISSAFGEIKYTGVDTDMSDTLRNGAVAGAHNNKYYISMKSEADGKWYLFVYDTSAGMWHKEDNTRVDTFCSCDGELYYIDRAEDRIKTILGSGTQETAKVQWTAETGVLGTSMSDKKYISRLNIRMSLAVGTAVSFYVQYDSEAEWTKISAVTGTSLRSFTLTVRPKRCDHFRLRIEGIGEAKIYSIAKTVEQGSDI